MAHSALPSSSWPSAQLDYDVLSSAHLPQQLSLYLCCTEQSSSGISDLALKYQLTSEKQQSPLCHCLFLVWTPLFGVRTLLYRKYWIFWHISNKWAQGKFKLFKTYGIGRIKLLLRKIPSAQFHMEFGWESCLNLVLKHSCETHEDATSVAHPTTLRASWEGNHSTNTEQ